MARLQFSVRTLLLATAIAALALAVLNTPNAWVSGPGLLVLGPGIPSAMLLVLLRSSGYRRAFLVGAVFPACAAEVALLNEVYGAAISTVPGLTLEGIDAFLNLLAEYDTRFVVGVCWMTRVAAMKICSPIS